MCITAKYAGTCRACGVAIKAGEKIEWSKDSGSRHITCPTTKVKVPYSTKTHSKIPLNSPGRGALQGRGRSDDFIGERSEIMLAFAAESRGDKSDLGETIKARDGRYLTCVGVGSHYVSQDEADDFDLVGPGGSFERHWSLTRHYRLATAEEQVGCDARIQRVASAKRFENLCNYGSDYPYSKDDAGKRNLPTADGMALAKSGVRIWRKSVGYSLHEGWRTEAGLLTYHPVYDDSPYYCLIPYAIMSVEDAEIVRSAQAVSA